MLTPVGVVLAGGKASRMGGGDKGRLMLGGRCLFDRVIDRLGPQVDAMAINANGPRDRLAEFGLDVVADTVPGQLGPLAGILAGMSWAASRNATHVVTVAADTPFFPEDLVFRLSQAAQRSSTAIAIAATEEGGTLRRHPVVGLWPVALRQDLASALEQGVRKVTYWADSHGSTSVLFDSMSFFNINTPEDLTQAEAMLPDIEK